MFVSAGSSARKPMCAALFLCAVLMIPLLQVPFARAEEFNAQEWTLKFLSDVVMLDLSKYNVTLRSYRVSYPVEYGGFPEEEVRYILETKGSYLDTTMIFRNSTFAYGILGLVIGPPIYIQPQPTNLVDVAKGVLDRYQAYAGSSRLQEMRGMLDSVSKAENTVVTSGNLKLEVIVGNTVGFIWKYNGIEVPPALSIVLQNGAIRSINDQMSIFTIDEEVKVSKEEAISIAVNRVQNFSWTVDGVPVGNFTIVRETLLQRCC